MRANAAQVRQFAVIACSYCARTTDKSATDYERKRAALYASCAGDEVALDLIAKISDAARQVADARRYFQNHRLDARADDDFQDATERLARLTNQLVGRVEAD